MIEITKADLIYMQSLTKTIHFELEKGEDDKAVSVIKLKENAEKLLKTIDEL